MLLFSLAAFATLLQRPHAGVAPAQRQQFGVGAAFDDLAGVHHQNLVGNQQRGFVLRGALQFSFN